MRQLLVIVQVAAALSTSTAVAQSVPLDADAFTDHVATLLRKEVGDESVVVRGRLTLGLGELQANLDRVFSYCTRERGACATEVQNYVKGAAQVHADRTAPPRREAIRLVVRTTAYVEAALASGGGKGAEIQPWPFVEGLVMLPVLDSPRTIRMLGPRESEKLGLSADQIIELGRENLRSALRPLMDVAKVASPGQIGQIAGDAYDPSRLLLHDTWAPLAQAQNGVLIVALPATDALFYVSEDSPVALDALRTYARSIIERAPNRLSDTLLRWTEDGWARVQ